MYKRQVEPEDIEISHKINKGKAIIAKFVNHKAKARLYKGRTKLKDVRLHDLFPGYPSSGNGRIYLNENLTPYRRELLKKLTNANTMELLSVCGPWTEKFISRPRRRGLHQD